MEGRQWRLDRFVRAVLWEFDGRHLRGRVRFYAGDCFRFYLPDLCERGLGPRVRESQEFFAFRFGAFVEFAFCGARDGTCTLCHGAWEIAIRLRALCLINRFVACEFRIAWVQRLVGRLFLAVEGVFRAALGLYRGAYSLGAQGRRSKGPWGFPGNSLRVVFILGLWLVYLPPGRPSPFSGCPGPRRPLRWCVQSSELGPVRLRG